MIFANKVIPILKEIKGKLRTYAETKFNNITNYKNLFNLLDIHETDNVLCYMNGWTENLVVS
jgi:hypothetical protein